MATGDEKSTAKKPAAKKAGAKKPTAKKPAAKKATAKKPTAKKPAAKKAAAKKPVAKKAAAKKPAAKKPATKKSAAKKSSAADADEAKTTKKTSAKKATTKKAAAKKTTAKKTTAKKTTAKKTTAKKTTAKTSTKKATASKTAKKSTKKTSSKKADGEAKPKKPKKRSGNLVIVESPAKARTIKKYLGKGYTVKASVGHVRDLPKSRIGVDVESGFEPEYVVINDKKKVIKDIQDAALGSEVVFLAPDPDREGEAIAWHIAEELKGYNENLQRVRFNEVTKRGITAALENPTSLDTNKTDAQQARRILDRLVGYEISPLLWKKVRRGLSAGRVQSVAVRLLVEREAEIAAFVPEEYWSVDCDLSAVAPPPFVGKIWRWDGEKAAPKTEAEATEIADELGAGPAEVASVEKKERRRRPQPPFITSKLQQEAARKLRYSAKRTMALAQRLYEGLELGDEGPTGLITYMRTDSTRVSDDALKEVREHIGSQFGPDYLPEKPNEYKKSKKAQDAHEAIRPTSVELTPERVAAGLEGHPEAKELIKLYRLIWNRFVSSQMTPAVYDSTTVDISRGRATLRSTGQVLKFAGFTTVYIAAETDDGKAEKASESDKLLPALAVGDAIKIDAIKPEQHFTQPPPRFSEASLVKELEERGIGRPSTYAAILSTIVSRGYAERKERRFWPTELGSLVNELLVESFPDILNADFTAQMEAGLDEVEEGERDWRDLLGGFYTPFQKDLEHAREHMRDVKREEIPTEHVCEKCESPMVIKWGRNGSFLACSGYPECRNTKEIRKLPDGKVEIVPQETTDEVCETCEAPMVVKRGRFGTFLACSRYPDCKTTKAISLGVDCPKEGCKGFLAEKRSRKGKVFYGCSAYAKTGCDFVTWDRPIPEKCPLCGAKFLLKKENRSGIKIRCHLADCGFTREGEDDEQAA